MQGSPSQVNGVGLRTLSRRRSRVRIPPPAPTTSVWFSTSNFCPKNKNKCFTFKNPQIYKGHVNKQTNSRLCPTHKTKPTQHTTTPKQPNRTTILRPPKRSWAISWQNLKMQLPHACITTHN